jgi:hypothetical protein
MVPLSVVNASRVGLRQPTYPAQLGQYNITIREERQRVMGVVEGLAMAGGGVFALLAMPVAKAPGKIALGALGGGLLIGSLLRIYDAVA